MSMCSRRLITLAVGGAVTMGLLVGAGGGPDAGLAARAQPPEQRTPNTPVYFERNVGQAPGSVAYLAHTEAGIMYLTQRGAVVWRTGTSFTSMSAAGGAAHPRLAPGDRLPGILSYFLGNDPGRWHTNIPTYGRITFLNIYPGIDLAFHGNGGRLEYDWVIRTGGDPGRIQLHVRGAGKLALDTSGALRLGSRLIRQTRPVMYQVVDGARCLVSGGYRRIDRSTIGLRVGSYDRSRALVIDPVILFSQLIGGESRDDSCCVKVDAKGNICLAGDTKSDRFPLKGAYQGARSGGADLFVEKLTPAGSLVYATYIGGTLDDLAEGLAVDGSGQAYVTGSSYSRDFPSSSRVGQVGGDSDVVVVKLSARGNALGYSVIAGGPGHDVAGGIAVDRSGHATIGGDASADGFPLVNPLAGPGAYSGSGRDGIVATLGGGGRRLIFSTYLGGSGDEAVEGVAIGGAGNLFVIGATRSPNFPVTQGRPLNASGDYDGFLVKIGRSK